MMRDEIAVCLEKGATLTSFYMESEDSADFVLPPEFGILSSMSRKRNFGRHVPV